MTSPEADVPFDLYGDLPDGRLAIEASAGTGKTFNLAALATRYLAERAVSPADLLIVTFTRAATAEIRSRIRDQLIEAAAALAGPDPHTSESELIRHLASHDRAGRQDRLERAVADFDAASISTIHGFATQVRRTLGLTPAIDPDARIVASPDELVRSACADALAAASDRDVPDGDVPKLSVLQKATRTKLGGPDLKLVPDGSDTTVDRRFLLVRELVEDAHRRLEARRLAEGTIGFDDVLIQLRTALRSQHAAAVIAALRSRYKVVLIDEFQDTDRVQWDIFSSLFGQEGSGSTLVLVGDPKQAIYRFRGADIAVYLHALRGSSDMARRTLGTNWRADGACLEALRALLQGASFGDTSIHYVPVEPAEVNRGRHMEDAAGRSLSGLDVRLAIGPDLPLGDKGTVDNEAVCRLIERDLAGHVRGLLERAHVPEGPRDAGLRRLVPSDVAVLVTGWGQARDLQAALRSEGIPAVIAGSGTVLDSEAATQFRYLLDGLERPGDPRRVRMFALSWFVGWTVEQVASMDDDELYLLQDRLMTWSGRLSDHPVAEVLGQAFRETDVVARVLGLPDGDRHVTDLDHLAELLHLGAPQGRAGPAGLLATLESPPDVGADADVDTDVTARRIESEAAAVQITTVWGAKGLEFPVVCLPMLWRKPGNRSALVYTDPDTGERKLDVTGNGEWPNPSALRSRKDVATTEESAERLRILYVALTRARHHTAVWWARNNSSKSNALTRLLFARGPDGVLVPHDLDPPRPRDCKLTLPDDDSIAAALDPLVEDSGGTIGVHVVPVREPPSEPWSDPSHELRPPELELAAFDRLLDRSVARWSFTSITQHASVDLVDPYDPSGSDQGADDEAIGRDPGEVGDPTAGPDDLPGAVAPPPPFELLGAGTAFGTFVHGVLEVVDFTASDLDGVLHDAILDVSRRRGIDLGALAPAGVDGTALLIEGLHAAIASPLGPLFHGAPLAVLDRAHRLDELAFDLRLGTPGSRPTVAAIGRLVADHLPGGDPLAPWAEALADGAIDIGLGGYLTGSMDLVARVRADDGSDRFVVADYKTNRLHRPGAPRRPQAYGAGALADAMIEHHYPLQALLYAVALHRYLRWKLRLTAGTTVVAGAAYLFVRGMTGPGVPVVAGHPDGVFTWEFDPALVLALSDLLAGRPDPGGPS